MGRSHPAGSGQKQLVHMLQLYGTSGRSPSKYSPALEWGAFCFVSGDDAPSVDYRCRTLFYNITEQGAFIYYTFPSPSAVSVVVYSQVKPLPHASPPSDIKKPGTGHLEDAKAENTWISIAKDSTFTIIMRVAIAGAGDVSKYIVEGLLEVGHEVVILTRSEKAWYKRDHVSLRITDYSVPALVKQLDDCEALISTIADYSQDNVTLHLALLAACTQSSKCKRFIPSEYAANLDEHPGQPVFYVAGHKPVRDALAAQKDVMYTLFNQGWLMDYFIPEKKRYQKDIGIFHPMSFPGNTLAIPGTGNEAITFTAARDLGRAIAAFIDKPDWEATTYVAGETTTYNKVVKLLAKHSIVPKKSYRSAAQLEEEIARGDNEDEVLSAQYDEWSISGGAAMPGEKTKRQKEKYFKGVHFRTVEEFLTDADKAVEGVAV